MTGKIGFNFLKFIQSLYRFSASLNMNFNVLDDRLKNIQVERAKLVTQVSNYNLTKMSELNSNQANNDIDDRKNILSSIPQLNTEYNERFKFEVNIISTNILSSLSC